MPFATQRVHRLLFECRGGRSRKNTDDGSNCRRFREGALLKRSERSGVRLAQWLRSPRKRSQILRAVLPQSLGPDREMQTSRSEGKLRTSSRRDDGQTSSGKQRRFKSPQAQTSGMLTISGFFISTQIRAAINVSFSETKDGPWLGVYVRSDDNPGKHPLHSSFTV